MKNLFSCYWRNFLALMLSLCLVASIVPEARAISIDEEKGDVQPYYIGTISISAGIYLIESGKAECWGHVDCYPGYTAEAAMRLQWLDGDVWRNYESWYGEDDSIDFYEIHSIPKGRTYRVRVIADIFDSDGNWVEMVDAVSGSLKY